MKPPPPEAPGRPAACACPARDYVSPEELAVLAEMRQVRQEVLQLRALLAALAAPDGEQRAGLLARLDQLGQAHRQLVRRRERARDEKLRRLGYEP